MLLCNQINGIDEMGDLQSSALGNARMALAWRLLSVNLLVKHSAAEGRTSGTAGTCLGTQHPRRDAKNDEGAHFGIRSPNLISGPSSRW